VPATHTLDSGLRHALAGAISAGPNGCRLLDDTRAGARDKWRPLELLAAGDVPHTLEPRLDILALDADPRTPAERTNLFGVLDRLARLMRRKSLRPVLLASGGRHDGWHLFVRCASREHADAWEIVAKALLADAMPNAAPRTLATLLDRRRSIRPPGARHVNGGRSTPVHGTYADALAALRATPPVDSWPIPERWWNVLVTGGDPQNPDRTGSQHAAAVQVIARRHDLPRTWDRLALTDPRYALSRVTERHSTQGRPGEKWLDKTAQRAQQLVDRTPGRPATARRRVPPVEVGPNVHADPLTLQDAVRATSWSSATGAVCRAVLLAHAQHADADGICRLPAHDAAAASAVSRDTVLRHRRRLARLGWLVPHKISPAGHVLRWRLAIPAGGGVNLRHIRQSPKGGVTQGVSQNDTPLQTADFGHDAWRHQALGHHGPALIALLATGGPFSLGDVARALQLLDPTGNPNRTRARRLLERAERLGLAHHAHDGWRPVEQLDLDAAAQRAGTAGAREKALAKADEVRQAWAVLRDQSRSRCAGTTLHGLPCQARPEPGSNLCPWHGPRCGSTSTRTGQPCGMPARSCPHHSGAVDPDTAVHHERTPSP
jgi:hypothetical protein